MKPGKFLSFDTSLIAELAPLLPVCAALKPAAGIAQPRARPGGHMSRSDIEAYTQ